jgi:hypothetical protein
MKPGFTVLSSKVKRVVKDNNWYWELSALPAFSLEKGAVSVNSWDECPV